MKVLSLPEFDENPYQRLLAEALRARGVQVRGARAYERRWLPLIHAVRTGPRPDVLHLHWTHPYIDRPGGSSRVSRLLASRLLFELRFIRALGIRIVWTIHNITKHERPDPRPEIAVSRRIVRLADAVIVHCEAAKRQATEAYGVPDMADRFHVTGHGSYLGVYEAADRAEARSRLAIAPDERVLLFFGQVRRYKGVPELIEAFRTIDDPAARLMIAGRPRTAEDRATVASLADGDARIRADLRHIPDDELARLISAADAVVFPFQDILTSSTVVLGMTLGKAVVAPLRGCLPETLDAAGSVLYDPNETDALASALRGALGADLAAMGRHNRDLAERLEWGPIADATIRAYGG